MKTIISKRLLFGFPIKIENKNFDEKLKFAKNYIKCNKLNLKLSIKGNKIEISVPSNNVKIIDIELTNYCNAHCIFCPQHKMSKLGYMNDETFFKAIDKIRTANISRIMFIGRGEPLLHPKILKYTKYIKENTGASLEIFTNAYVLVPNLIDRFANLNNNDEFLNLRINVSLHSLDRNTHNKLVGLSLKTIIENLRYLISKKEQIGYSICFVKNKINEQEMYKLRKYFDKVGIKNADIALIYNKGGHIQNPDLFDFTFYSQNFKNFEIASWEKKKLCSYTYNKLSYFLNYRGEFTTCHDDFEDKFKLGAIVDTSFEEIEKKIDKLRKIGGTSQCKKCTKYLRELFHGEDKDIEAIARTSFTL